MVEKTSTVSHISHMPEIIRIRSRQSKPRLNIYVANYEKNGWKSQTFGRFCLEN